MKKITLAATIATAVLLAACGKEDTPAPAPATSAPAVEAPKAEAPKVETPATAAPAAPAAAQASAADPAIGKKIYGATCALCHASGVAGAPVPGNKDDWSARIAQGKETLYQHSIEGFTGAKGMMPARGGNPRLTDDEMKAAVDFMVDQSH